MGVAGAAEQHQLRVARFLSDDPLGIGVERGQRRLQLSGNRREVGLRDHQCVGHRRLPRRLGKAGERRGAVLGVDHRYHPAEPQPRIQHRIGAERVEDRRRVGEAAGLDDDAAERPHRAGIAPLDEVAEGARHILAHRAAQAPAGQLQHRTLDEIHEVMVDRHRADLVDDDRGVGEVRRGERAAQQTRPSAPSAGCASSTAGPCARLRRATCARRSRPRRRSARIEARLLAAAPDAALLVERDEAEIAALGDIEDDSYLDLPISVYAGGWPAR